MVRHAALTLGLTLALMGAGSWADDRAGRYNGAPSQTLYSLTEPDQGADLSQPQIQDDTDVRILEKAIDADVDQERANEADIDQENAQPRAVTPSEGARTDTTTPRTESGAMTGLQPMWSTDTIHTPLQGFVSAQVHEVGELAPQIDFFKAANRPDVVQVLYHMVRDHVLVSDAAKNVLARRGDVSRPVSLMPAEPMPTTAEEMIRHNIAMHEQALERTRGLLANASSTEERNIYQTAERATQKHLEWLRRVDHGERVALGYFGPTIPLSQIAGYRAEIGTRSSANRSRRMRNMRRR